MMMRSGSGSAPLFVAMWCGWRLDESDDARRRGTTTTPYTPGVCVVLACASLFLSSDLFGLASLLTSAIFVTRHDGASSSTTTFQNPARSADRAALRACSSRGGGARKKAVSSVR